MFDPFYRADESRNRAGRGTDGHPAEGTGLGLSIVAAIAEAHGGTVSVVSDPQGGSTFEVRLPSNHASGQSSVAQPDCLGTCRSPGREEDSVASTSPAASRSSVRSPRRRSHRS